MIGPQLIMSMILLSDDTVDAQTALCRRTSVAAVETNVQQLT